MQGAFARPFNYLEALPWARNGDAEKTPRKHYIEKGPSILQEHTAYVL